MNVYKILDEKMVGQDGFQWELDVLISKGLVYPDGSVNHYFISFYLHPILAILSNYNKFKGKKFRVFEGVSHKETLHNSENPVKHASVFTLKREIFLSEIRSLSLSEVDSTELQAIISKENLDPINLFDNFLSFVEESLVS